MGQEKVHPLGSAPFSKLVFAEMMEARYTYVSFPMTAFHLQEFAPLIDQEFRDKSVSAKRVLGAVSRLEVV